MEQGMDQENSPNIDSDGVRLGGKSWTAYVGIALMAIILIPISIALAWRASLGLGLAMLVVVLLILTYQVAETRSYRLYYDDVGIWLFSGILPWKKGVVGVKWRDLDEAVYFQTFWSWLFKSYSMRIGHRFTKSSEILLSHMASGHDLVKKINEQHQQLVRENALH